MVSSEENLHVDIGLMGIAADLLCDRVLTFAVIPVSVISQFLSLHLACNLLN